MGSLKDRFDAAQALDHTKFNLVLDLYINGSVNSYP